MYDIATITQNGLCSGCGMCAGMAGEVQPPIVMRETAAGYRRPEVVGQVGSDLASLIDATCPGVNIRHLPGTHDGEYHPIWGPLIAARLGWSTDPELRKNASSGGGLSGLLVHLLASGEIDYVVQTAVSPDSPVRNALTVSTGREDVFLAAGSRYAPSSPLEDIGARLDAPGKFAFVGKPCDVAGLRQLARHDPRVNAKVPYMIAFMCAGVPSYRGTSALLKAMGVEEEARVTAFRYRGDGWPGFATARLEDGTALSMDYDTSWGRILNRHLQFRCKICPDGIGEFADIVCADGWYCDDDGNPLFDEREGRSIMLTRTLRGEALLGRAMEAKAVITEPLTLKALGHMQPFQARRKGLVVTRLAAMTLTGKRSPRFAGLELFHNARNLGLKDAIKSFGGTLRRLIGKKRVD